ncbi:MAG TPA: LysR family transcriptional regulator [Polyangiaceae bacterium]|nr:LysR family transcriptional regulator [Polyangiaceae bacterium]
MSLSALDLNLLLVLETVLAERSVVRAAHRLRVTPSAISNALARLRAHLGDPLIARKGRGIVPTPRALELAPILSRTLAEIDQALHGAAFDPATSTRSFSLAVADAGQLVRIPGLARLMAVEMPHARLRVLGIDSLVSLGGLSGTEVDVAIGVDERGPGVHLEALFDEPTALVARRDHPVARRRLSKAKLESLRHVAVEMAPGKGFRDATRAVYARAGIARDAAITVPTFHAAAAIVAGTDYVATLPRSLVEVLAPKWDLVTIGPTPPHVVTMYLRWHDRTHADAAMIAFRALVRRAVGGALSSAMRASTIDAKMALSVRR